MRRISVPKRFEVLGVDETLDTGGTAWFRFIYMPSEIDAPEVCVFYIRAEVRFFSKVSGIVQIRLLQIGPPQIRPF